MESVINGGDDSSSVDSSKTLHVSNLSYNIEIKPGQFPLGKERKCIFRGINSKRDVIFTKDLIKLR